MGWIVYFLIGLLFQYTVYGEPTSILTLEFILHVSLWWAFGIWLMLSWMFWPTLILIAAFTAYFAAKRWLFS